MHDAEPQFYFASWRYDQATGRLFHVENSALVHKLEPRLHQLLNYFLQHPQQIITKDQLLDDVWPADEGTDGAVMRAIASLRKILQGGMNGIDAIETLPKRGYRWLIMAEKKLPPVATPPPARWQPSPSLRSPQTLISPQTSSAEPPTSELLTSALHTDRRQDNAGDPAPGAVVSRVVETEPPQQQSSAVVSLQSKQRRYGLLWLSCSLILLIALVLLVLELGVVSLGQQQQLPGYHRMQIISAMNGRETAPLMDMVAVEPANTDAAFPESPAATSPAALFQSASHGLSQVQGAESLMYYQYQAPASTEIQWLRHELGSHRKRLSPQTFSQLSHALWLDAGHFIFQGVQQGQCHFYRQQKALTAQAQRIRPCQQWLKQGLARDQQSLYWLDQDQQSGQVQLWQLPLHQAALAAAQPVLITQFPAAYRKASNLLLHQQTLLMVLQKDFNSSSLLQWDLQRQRQSFQKDFAFNFDFLASWDQQSVLISAMETLLVYQFKADSTSRLTLVEGIFQFAQRQQQNLLAVFAPAGNKDLLPLSVNPVADGHADPIQPSVVQSSLASSRDDYLLAVDQDQLALVSERSGLPQIWLQQPKGLTQLSHFEGQRQISQLLWHQQQLLAVIDATLVRLEIGSGTAVPLGVEGLARVSSCAGKLYFTQWHETGWQLWQYSANGAAELLLNDVVDVRCGPGQQLVLQMSTEPQLKLWLPGNHQAGQLQQLPLALPWRQMPPEHWFTTRQGIYWLDTSNGHTRLASLAWSASTPEFLPLAAQAQPMAIYGDWQGQQRYYQQESTAQSDVVWLQP